MANPKKRVPENVPGDFFVDSTCIDCDACRQIAPAVFGEAAETSFVKAQPASSADRRQALQALLACPTGSIGCLGDDDVKAVMKDFPLVDRGAGLLLRLQLAEVVWRQQLLHPAPRRQLADRLAEVRHAARAAVGGAGRHRPHLPDPPRRRGRRRALRRAFRAAAASSIGTSCRRSPVRKSSSTATGRGSWPPASSPSRRRATRRATASCSSRTASSSPATTWIGTGTSSSLSASEDYCWYSWPQQAESMERLADYRFEWVLPGHGQRVASARRDAGGSPALGRLTR